MKRTYARIGLSLAALLFVAAGCYSKTTTSSTTTGAGNAVSIANLSFSPTSLTVKKGTSVIWTNNDSATHTVTRDGADGPSSGSIENSQTYSFTFSQTGTFTYHCSIHPSMSGTVTVTE